MPPARLTRRAACTLPWALAACDKPAARNRLSFWAMSYEGDYAPLLMVPFTKATGIAVDTQSLPWTEAHEKLLTAHAGGALPDVMMLPNGWVTEFALIGALAPLDDPALTADLVDGAKPLPRLAGHVRAIPWSMAPQVQFYRADILHEAGYDRPPTDWDGWRAMGHAIRRRRPNDYAFLLLLNWWDTLFTFMAQAAALGGTTLLREHNTRGNFATAEGRAALGFYLSLFTDKLAPPVLSTEIADPVASFAQGYFAIMPYGPTLLADLRRRRAEIPETLWGTERMPGPHGPRATSATSASLAVSARSPRPAQARALLAHLSAAPTELHLQSLIGTLPAAASAWASPQLATPILAPFAAQVHAPPADPPVVEWERIRIETQLVAERVVRGQLGVTAGLAEMDRRADRILRQRRALVQAGRIT